MPLIFTIHRRIIHWLQEDGSNGFISINQVDLPKYYKIAENVVVSQIKSE